MTKEPTPPPKPRKPSASGESLASLRTQIDRLDRELVKLISQRAKLALQTAKHKEAAGDPPYQPTRETEILQRVVEANKGPLTNECVRACFRELISGSRALERPLRVAFLGPHYSYSHLASIERFGTSVEPVPVTSISAVFEEVNRGQANYGVVPVENSTDGRIADTLDNFTRLPVKVCGEVQLRIHHSLLARCPRAEVQEVYSRPQALSQCRHWLTRHLPAARPIEVTSTSTAAQLAQDKPGAAAIASVQAGVHYGLDILAENIEDNTANVTRFAVIGGETGPRTGHDKTSAMFEVEHRPGGLADAINIFKRARLNLTWIESFPIPNSDGRYLFFVELDGHEVDSRVRKALELLGKKSLRLEILGSYPKTTPVG